jgi:WS/DGAT/MGAT family acyltransferase
MGKYLLQIARKEIPSPDVSAPKTILNKPVGPHRVFDAAEFPLSGFKSIKNVAGVTLNDVALGVIGGALQRYLEAKGEAPQGSLVAGLPLNMRTRRETTEDNNQVGSVFSSLHTNISNPLDRLQAVHHSTMEAKEYGEHSPMVDALKIAGAFSPFLMKAASSLWSRNKLSRHMPLTISTVISNVAGPSFPLYCAGAKMIDYYGLGLLTPGVGIFHLVFSYSGKLTLSVLADRDIMPDPQFYHDCLHASYDELYLAAEALTEKPKADSKVLPVSRKKAKAKAKPKSKPKANANANAKKVSVKPKAKVKPKFKAKPKIRQKAKS